MKLRAILTTAIFTTLAWLGTAAIATAGEMPNGSYLETCINCSLSGNTLSCWCRKDGSHTEITHLQYANQCLYAENQQGRLACTRGYFKPLPAGSYQATCKNCSFDGNDLGCSCQSPTGYFSHQASLKNAGSCRNDIIYNNEGLICSNLPLPARFAEASQLSRTPFVIPGSAPIAAAPAPVVANKPAEIKTANKTAPASPAQSLFGWMFKKSEPAKQVAAVGDVKKLPSAVIPTPVAVKAAPIAVKPAPTAVTAEAKRNVSQDEWQPLTAFEVVEATAISQNKSQDNSQKQQDPAPNQEALLNAITQSVNGVNPQNTSAELPSGNYQQSCQSCQYKNDRLSCLCKDNGLRLKITKLLNPSRCAKINNINGVLGCVGA